MLRTGRGMLYRFISQYWGLLNQLREMMYRYFIIQFIKIANSKSNILTRTAEYQSHFIVQTLFKSSCQHEWKDLTQINHEASGRNVTQCYITLNFMAGPKDFLGGNCKEVEAIEGKGREVDMLRESKQVWDFPPLTLWSEDGGEIILILLHPHIELPTPYCSKWNAWFYKRSTWERWSHKLRC